MKSTNVPGRRFYNRSAIFLLTVLALALPTVLASGPTGQIDSSSSNKSAPFAVYPGYERFDIKTKATIVLPSQKYGLPVHAKRNAYQLSELDSSETDHAAPNQVGIDRRLDLMSSQQGRRFENPDGSKVRILVITAPGAKSLRMRFENFNLPEGDEVYAYGLSSDSHVAGPYTGRGPLGSDSFWADAVEGETIVIEHFIKRHETGFRLAALSHIFGSIDAGRVSAEVLSCEVDASCSGAGLGNEVGRLLFQSGGGAFVCTGTMLNNQRSDFTPFFLTAAHCISSESEASSAQVYWFYQTTHCDNNTLRSDIAVTSGAILIATSQKADSSLLKLSGAIPPGVGFAGWNADPLTSSQLVYGLHHPGGGIPPSTVSFLRRAAGNLSIAPFNNCGATGLVNGYRVSWQTGLVEPGSSGSGVFLNQGGGLVGVLSCGPANLVCSSAFALYGRLSDFYPQVQVFLEGGSGGDNCVSALFTEQQNFGLDGGLATVVVTATSACVWKATTNASWLTVLNGGSGAGGGLLGLAIEKNTGPPRSATVTIQNKTLSIHQEGIPCTYALTPTARTVSSSGGSGSIDVTAPGGCQWAGVPDVSWITVTSPNSSGNGTLTYTVEPNPTGGSRSGHISIAGQTVTITQETGPAITSATIEGKQLIVTGVNFVDGAELLVDGVKQKKTFNDETNPTTIIVARKSGKTIARGQTVNLQVRNPDGQLSQQFSFTRP